MQKMTSAYANKMLRSLMEDKEYFTNKEASSYTYTAAVNEEPVIPDYDYKEVADTIAAIDEKICILKHAINLNNTISKVTVGGEELSIDTILIKMAQLNKRKDVLDYMRKQLPKTRVNGGLYSARNNSPEYTYINYDLDLIKKEYEVISGKILEMQMALDYYNQTVQFEVEL